MHTLITNCRIIDAESDMVREGSIGFTDGIITSVGDTPADAADNTIDAEGKLVIPGLIDCYSRLREPGFEKLATIATETRAAAHSAITTIMCSPDTDPVTDEPAIVELIKRRASAAGGIRVLPIGAATMGQQGEQLGELRTLADSGCIAFSNGDHPLANTQVIRRLMEYSSGFGLKLIIAPQDPWLSDGVAHEGMVSTRLGLRAIPAAAETVALSQLIELCYQTGATVHFSRLSSHRGVQLVSQAKKDGIKITADTGIDHLFLTEMDTSDFDSMCHTSPPFRSRSDLDALREGVATGVIDAICSNHAPHETDSKLAPFPESLPGTSSLDSFLGLLFKLSEDTRIPLPAIIARATAGPADCFALPQGRLTTGSAADLAIIDDDCDWEFHREAMHSQGKNSPYEGWLFRACPSAVFVDGKPLELHR
ncbi:MAG: dihydroorotase [Pseudomonadota bacterium]